MQKVAQEFFCHHIQQNINQKKLPRSEAKRCIQKVYIWQHLFFPSKGNPPRCSWKSQLWAQGIALQLWENPNARQKSRSKEDGFQPGKKEENYDHGPWLLDFLLLFIYMSPISMISMISISINRYSTLVTVIIDTQQSYQSYPPRSDTTMLFSVSSASSPVLTSEGLTHRTSKTQTVLTWPDTTSQQEPQKGRI